MCLATAARGASTVWALFFMADLKGFSGAHIIDTTEKPSWWMRHHMVVIAWVAAVASLLGAAASWWAAAQNSAVTRQGFIAEHRPVLEITSFEFMDKNNMLMFVKNAGRSTAFRVHNDLWCDIGKYSGGIIGPALRIEQSIMEGSTYSPDVPTGGTFQMNAFIVGEGWFNSVGAHYTDESSVRLRGILHYQDAEHDPFALPWCYESFHPKKEEKLGAIPCYDIPAGKVP